jgi:hypothetical protein
MKKHVIFIIIAVLLIATVAFAAGEKAITPSTHNQWDLGTAGLSYKDIRIVGDLWSNGVKVIDGGVVVGSALSPTTTTATITPANTGADITVPAGSTLIDTQKVSGFNNDVTITKSIIVGTTWIINTDAHAGTLLINGVYF